MCQPSINKYSLPSFLATICLFACPLLLGTPIQADEHAEALNNYLTDDVIAVVYFDLAKIEPVAALQQIHQLGVIDEAELTQYAPGADYVKSQLDRVLSAGIQVVYVLVRVSDMGDQGPSIVMPLAAGTDAAKSADTIKEVFAAMGEEFSSMRIRAGENAVFITSSESQMKRMLTPEADSKEKNQPRDLSAAWQAVGSGSAGLLVFGDVDSRRVIRGLFPKLPPPFDTLTGKLIADDLNWAGVQLDLPPSLKIKLEFETRSEQANDVFVAGIRNGLDLLGGHPEFESLLPESERPLVLKTLQPIKSGTRTIVSVDAVTGDMDRMSRILVPQILAVREAAREQSEVNNLRQIALALLNYEFAHQKFPRADGKSDDHPAGLSWRVHILPYMEENNLYQLFKLDEPWDSEHNLPLAKHMPPVYQSPMRINSEANRESRTVYQVPICPEAIFQPAADTAGFSDIHDGTSNTIFLVAVAPEEAVVWTKPDDWEVDLENPLAGLIGGKRERIAAALCDSSTHQFPITIKPEILRALITRSGGEIVTDW